MLTFGFNFSRMHCLIRVCSINRHYLQSGYLLRFYTHLKGLEFLEFLAGYSYQSEVGSDPRKAGIFILVWQCSMWGRPASMCLLHTCQLCIDIISLLNTQCIQYIHFCILVAWPALDLSYIYIYIYTYTVEDFVKTSKYL